MAVTAYNRFVGSKLKKGYSMAEAAKMWKSHKRKKGSKSKTKRRTKSKTRSKRKRRGGSSE